MNSQRVWLVLFGVWFAVVAIVGAAGGFAQPGPPLVLGAAVAIPPLLTILGWRYVPAVRRALLAVDLRHLVLLHVARLEGAIFFLDALRGELPMGFAIPAGFGDVIAAIGALVLLTARRPARRTFLAWNVFGLLDLVVAVTLGVLYSASPVGVLSTTASNTSAIGYLPLILIPGFYVPLLISSHLVALLRRNELTDSDQSLPASRVGLLHSGDDQASDRGLHTLVAGAGKANERIE
ncbi:hypothetical protein [Smaragdicoccus niigatensis]|uniref:hypothetical protein n=1 Tax=Smaragdicoccus niigatensis TaxID=359359 RepID=UPI00036435C1|nr:hypothetical protein [Smaragdicoccus niigatensis]